MAQITLKGNAINTVGNLPSVGEAVKDFVLVGGDLSEKSLKDFDGKRKVLNIVPSLDTGICAASARKFNELVSSMDNTVVLVVSEDLPFAQSRFCEVEGLKNVVALSSFRSNFGDDYGVKISDGPLKGLSSRAIVVLNENNQVIYNEQVPEIAQEPDYEKALNSLK